MNDENLVNPGKRAADRAGQMFSTGYRYIALRWHRDQVSPPVAGELVLFITRFQLPWGQCNADPSSFGNCST